MPQIIHRTEAPTTIPANTPMARQRGWHVPHDQIAQLAYQLWEQAGRPEGRDLDFWLQAEAELERRPLAPTRSPRGGEGAATGEQPPVHPCPGQKVYQAGAMPFLYSVQQILAKTGFCQ